jgi:predicted nucleotidyltransferase
MLDPRTDPTLLAEVAGHPYPLIFATVSGAHLYGFPSPDSDVDLRGAHVTPTTLLTGLDRVEETVKSAHVRDGVEVDLVTHEARKFFALLLRDNGYVLEQLYSPLVVRSTPEHEELKAIARNCVTRACDRHYLGFAANQWNLFVKESPRRVKPLLYVFRVLLTGIRLMRTGELDANLPSCNEAMGRERLSWLDELVAMKVTGAEQGSIGDGDFARYEHQYLRLRALLSDAASRCTLPATSATAVAPMKDLLYRIRLASRDAASWLHSDRITKA